MIVGAVYRSTVFPPEYRGNLFIGDFANRWIRRLVFDEFGELADEQVFIAAPDAGPVVDIRQGPEGALYWVTYGTPAGASTGAIGAVYRASYGIGGNQSPVAHATAAPVAGLPPLEVRFSSSGSFDPDGGPSPLEFTWDFDDGNTSTEETPTHTFTAAGVYSVTLTADDGAAQSTSDALAIEVGNPPLAKILQPPPGTTYRAGDEIFFAGEAVDVEDGSLPATALTWVVELVHAGHAHPFLGPIEGVASGSFTVPLSGHPPEHTSYRIRLSAIDEDGLSSDVARDLEPIVSPILFDTWPAHVPLYIDGEAQPTPREYESLVGYVHGVEAPRWHVGESQGWLFWRWSDSGARQHDYI
ncbi:MAG: PKD domain-containing protein, partial [Actinobacteria bacterium]|nr:PKD domain-containing protein [Actinomycetota bacterium]